MLPYNSPRDEGYVTGEAISYWLIREAANEHPAM